MAKKQSMTEGMRLSLVVSIMAHTLVIGLARMGGTDTANVHLGGDRELTVTILPAPLEPALQQSGQLNPFAPNQHSRTTPESFRMLSEPVVPRIEEPLRPIVMDGHLEVAPGITLITASPLRAAAMSNPETTPDEPGSAGSVQAGPSARAAYRNNPQPPYPLAARRRGQEGLVTLRVRVTPGGEPEHVELKESSGFPLLDDAAIIAVRGWEFEPARRNGSQVASEVDVPVRFALTD